jgi:hypothetical protein
MEKKSIIQQRPVQIIISIVAFALVGGAVFTFLGWCTGDTNSGVRGPFAVQAGFATLTACNASRATLAMGGGCGATAAVTGDATTWSGAQTCTPRGRCAACTKLVSTTAPAPVCVANAATGLFDVQCSPTHDLDCDCP